MASSAQYEQQINSATNAEQIANIIRQFEQDSDPALASAKPALRTKAKARGAVLKANADAAKPTVGTPEQNSTWDTAKQVVRDVGGRVLNAVNTWGNTPPRRQAPTSPYLHQQAEQLRQASGRMQGDAQRGYQIANRNERVQGDQDAAASAAAQFTQGVAQTSGAAGAGAAALANMRTVDPSQYYQQHRQRADQQQAHAEQVQTQAELAAVNATGNDALAAAQDYAHQNVIDWNRQAGTLSNPEQDNDTGTGKPDDSNTEQTPVSPAISSRARVALGDRTNAQGLTDDAYNALLAEAQNALKSYATDGGAAWNIVRNKAQGYGFTNISTDPTTSTIGGKTTRYNPTTWEPVDGSDKRLKVIKRRFI